MQFVDLNERTCVVGIEFTDAAEQDWERDPQASSTYQLLETRCGVRPTRIRQVVRAEMASESIAGLLAAQVDSPILVLDRITYTSDGTPVEWGLLAYRYDRIECSVELVRQVESRQERARLFEVRYSEPLVSGS